MSNSKRTNTKSTTSKAVTPSKTQTSRKTTAVAKSATPNRVVHIKHDIQNYSFEYLRDRVSRQRGASYFRVEGNGNGEDIEMTLQEAQSLYNFLGKALNQD